MKQFKDLNNNVHEIEAGFENLLPKGSVEITQAEADVLLAPPPPTKQEIIKSISDALQQTMEDAASAKGYDSLLSVINGRPSNPRTLEPSLLFKPTGAFLFGFDSISQQRF